MGKIVQRFSRVFIMMLMIMSVPFFFNSSVSAATIQVNGLNGNQAIVTDSSGKRVSDTQGLNEYNYYQVKYNWSIPDSVTIKPGDTAQFTLPSNIRVRSTETFNITASQGEVVGHATVNAGASTGTITFTNIPALFRYNRHGTLTFYGQGKVVPKTDVNSWMINKGGWVDNKTLNSKGNPTQLYWNVVLNPAGKKLTGVSFTDKPQKGQTIISNSVEVYQVNSSNKLGKKLSPKITMNSDGSMSLDLGNISTPIYIEYKVSLSKDVSNSATTEWENVGIINWNGGSSAHTTALVRHGGSGTEIGYNGSVELHKVDAITKKSLAGAVFDLESQSGKVLQSNLTTDSNGNLIVKNLKDGNYQFVEVKAPQGYQINSKPIKFTINDSSSNAVSVKVTAENQPLKSSSSKKSSSSVKASSNNKNSSSKKSSSSKISSSSKKSSSVKSSSSKRSSSIKSSAKSSSEASSRKSSMIKSSSRTSSKKASSSSKISSSSKNSSNIKSSSSKKSSSSVKASSSSKKSSSLIKSSAKSSSEAPSKESSVESSSKEVASSSSMKSTTAKSHRGGVRPVKSSSSVESSSNINTESSSTMNTVSSSANKPSKDTETSVKVPSKTSTISYVDKSTEKSVPVTVSSETNTMIESSISSAVRTGSGSSSFGSSMVYKPTLVSSSMNVPATSWSKEIVNGSSATTVVTYSQSEIPNTNKESNRVINKPTANTATTHNVQNTTVINNNNNHSANQGGVTVVGNNNNNGNNAQGNKSGKGNGNGHGEGLPQTGEAAATAAVGLGIALIVISGIVVLEKKD